MVSSIPVGALAAWLGKVWASRIAREESAEINKEIEKLKGRILNTQNVFRIQFEKEFAIYQAQSSELAHIRNLFGHWAHHGINDAEKKDFEHKMLTAMNAFLGDVNMNEAFMHESVYKQAILILGLLTTFERPPVDPESLTKLVKQVDIETKKYFSTVRDRINSLNSVD